jgi:2-hydroxy-6-oxonona-2,4-dienedioate hydrolase
MTVIASSVAVLVSGLDPHTLPTIQFFCPDECGHQGQADRPELFNPLHLEFFRDGRVARRIAEAAGISKRRPGLAHLVEQS